MAQTPVRPLSFRLSVGRSTVDATAPRAALADFIERANRPLRIEGLPDQLNPDLIDPQKTASFVAGLSRLDADTLHRLAGHDLRLDNYALRIQVAAPTTPASFEQPFGLTIDRVIGKTVIAEVNAQPDLDLAKTHAENAGQLFPGLADKVGQKLATHTMGASLTLAMRQRLAVARAWRMNAQAWTDLAPGDDAGKKSLQAAIDAVRASAMAPAGGTIPP